MLTYPRKIIIKDPNFGQYFYGYIGQWSVKNDAPEGMGILIDRSVIQIGHFTSALKLRQSCLLIKQDYFYTGTHVTVKTEKEELNVIQNTNLIYPDGTVFRGEVFEDKVELMVGEVRLPAGKCVLGHMARFKPDIFNGVV